MNRLASWRSTASVGAPSRPWAAMASMPSRKVRCSTSVQWARASLCVFGGGGGGGRRPKRGRAGQAGRTGGGVEVGAGVSSFQAWRGGGAQLTCCAALGGGCCCFPELQPLGRVVGGGDGGGECKQGGGGGGRQAPHAPSPSVASSLAWVTSSPCARRTPLSAPPGTRLLPAPPNPTPHRAPLPHPHPTRHPPDEVDGVAVPHRALKGPGLAAAGAGGGRQHAGRAHGQPSSQTLKGLTQQHEQGGVAGGDGECGTTMQGGGRGPCRRLSPPHCTARHSKCPAPVPVVPSPACLRTRRFIGQLQPTA